MHFDVKIITFSNTLSFYYLTLYSTPLFHLPVQTLTNVFDNKEMILKYINKKSNNII
jgi:hypothetical protein